MSDAPPPTPSPTPAPAHIRGLEDIRAGDLKAADLLTLLHWRLLHTAAPQFIDHADAAAKLEQLAAALKAR